MTIRSGGCGRFLGSALILVGAVILLAYYGVIPGRITKWWPVLIIAFGALLLGRHYVRLIAGRRSMPDVLDANTPWARLPRGSSSFAPPAMPIVVMALGLYLLLSNLNAIGLRVIVAVLLILAGLGVLLRSPRPWNWRSSR